MRKDCPDLPQIVDETSQNNVEMELQPVSSAQQDSVDTESQPLFSVENEPPATSNAVLEHEGSSNLPAPI